MHYELSVAARMALAQEYESEYMIAYENVEFTPPKGGGIWLKYDYKEADTIIHDLKRKCISYIGMVQPVRMRVPRSPLFRPPVPRITLSIVAV